MRLFVNSQGMDLFSRRNMWDAVRGARQGKGIILTTHSMEEAEALCDRIGIFVAGRMVAVGSPKELKAKHGEYTVLRLYIANMNARFRTAMMRTHYMSIVHLNLKNAVTSWLVPVGRSVGDKEELLSGASVRTSQCTMKISALIHFDCAFILRG